MLQHYREDYLLNHHTVTTLRQYQPKIIASACFPEIDLQPVPQLPRVSSRSVLGHYRPTRNDLEQQSYLLWAVPPGPPWTTRSEGETNRPLDLPFLTSPHTHLAVPCPENFVQNRNRNNSPLPVEAQGGDIIDYARPIRTLTKAESTA